VTNSKDTDRTQVVLPAALILTVLTGFAGLVYEVAWQKYLAMLLGSHAEATAAVLGIFLGGLSAGYALFGRLTRRVARRAQSRGEAPRLLYIYALVEAGIGLYALLFPWTFGLAQQISLLGPTSTGMAFAFDIGLSALLLGPPTLLMGGTIPILTLALAGDLDRATRVHAWIYGLNTAGAFAGALAGGFVLVPLLGLDPVMLSMGFLNLFAAAAFALLDRSHREFAPDLSMPPDDQPIARLTSWATVALLAGFAMMTLQTTLNRIGGLAFGSSQFTFAMVVAVFVLCIALGSLGVSAFKRIPRGFVVGSQWLLVFLLFPLYIVMGDAPYWAHVIRVIFRPVDLAFYAYQASIFAGLLLLLVVPIGLSGALLPLLFNELRREVRELGSVAGRLYAWNTIGSMLGALVGGYVLFIWLDLHQIYRLSSRDERPCRRRFASHPACDAAPDTSGSRAHHGSDTGCDLAPTCLATRPSRLGTLPGARAHAVHVQRPERSVRTSPSGQSDLLSGRPDEQRGRYGVRGKAGDAQHHRQWQARREPPGRLSDDGTQRPDPGADGGAS